MAVVTMRQLLEAGVHFGHQTRRWNPKMKRFIFGERNGIYIIDLNQTLQRLEVAYSFVRDLVADGGNVLFVGTKKQAQDPIARFAELCAMPYVNERWLGGMLTNFTTISGRVGKMQEFERMRRSGDFEAMPKKEALLHSRELEKLERNLGGIRSMGRLPDAVFIIDIKKEHIAVSEANKMGIPIVAVVDTNCDPDVVQFPIPGNDDAIRSGTLLCRVMADAVQEGRFIASRRGHFASEPQVHPEASNGPARVPSEAAPAASEAAPAASEAAPAASEAAPAASEAAHGVVGVAAPGGPGSDGAFLGSAPTGAEAPVVQGATGSPAPAAPAATSVPATSAAAPASVAPAPATPATGPARVVQVTSGDGDPSGPTSDPS
jgi:small subunit ribosomal protein S2